MPDSPPKVVRPIRLAVSAAGVESASGEASTDFAGPVEIGGGRTLYLACRGTGSPTVLFESGIHDSSEL